ncbi:MAG: TauD/TfdA family dioxygenase [Scytonematopsis contorta HA4267-MV1]|jgi:Fe(II)/alpha-ketoglutarate-dependent arginine beta-hydroxylase|nr:TauD/TfdA family dioxygenase [Scytonematopsis contorta HA4267-MV1]
MYKSISPNRELDNIPSLVLTPQEITEIKSLLRSITFEYNSIEDTNFLNKATLFAQELPRRIREVLNDFRLVENNLGACIISGYPINDSKIGKTPTHWEYKADKMRTLEEQILFVLYSSLLGDVFGWSTQQDGYIIHDVFPIQKNENDQIGTGSMQPIWWHTEDAFHPYRADYIGLMCLRNPEHVPTTISDLDVNQLSKAQVEILSEPHFVINLDESHKLKNGSNMTQKLKEKNLEESVNLAYDKVSEINTNYKEKVSILFGYLQSPYLRLDPYFMDNIEDKEEIKSAFHELVDIINKRVTLVTLKPGDICFIDNYRSVHGRKPFKANYDGNDRWLKRINITKDLRKSRSARAKSTSRIIL